MKKTVFTGVATAIITPFYTDGSVNYEALDRLIEYQIANGADAIVTCGTTGESATLDHNEHCSVMKHTIEKINHRVPVIAGTGSNDTAYALKLSQEAESMGADALLLVSPYYNKTSQTGLIKHFNYVAERVSLPCILYNVPSRTGCNIKPETYHELSKTENIVAAKEANGDISSVAETLALCGDNLQVYSGNDDQTIPILSLGGKGVISVFSNICPAEMHRITSLWFEGKLGESRALFLKWLDLMNALFIDVNPIPIKEAANQMGFEAGSCRLPLTDMGERAHAKLLSVMKAHGLIS